MQFYHIKVGSTRLVKLRLPLVYHVCFSIKGEDGGEGNGEDGVEGDDEGW